MTSTAAINRITRPCVACALCAALAACGSSSASSTTTAAGGAPALIAAESCIRGYGIDIPDVTPTSSAAAHAALQRTLVSEPPAKLKSAEKACKTQITKALPQGNGLTPVELERRLRGLELFASCMRAHPGAPIPTHPALERPVFDLDDAASQKPAVFNRYARPQSVSVAVLTQSPAARLSRVRTVGWRLGLHRGSQSLTCSSA